MDLPTAKVVVCETNRTRGDLYALWLQDYEVEVVLTRSEAGDAFETATAVAVVDRGFADGDTRGLLAAIRSRSPVCRVVATQERSSLQPENDVDERLVKPLSKERLRSVVETHVARANYHAAIELFYSLRIELSSVETAASEVEMDEGEYQDLRTETERLRAFLASLSTKMTAEDVTAVKRAISLRDAVGRDADAPGTESKYRPSKCSACGVDWSGPLGDPDTAVRRLGAHVWRCEECGYVDMHSDPSHRRVSYR